MRYPLALIFILTTLLCSAQQQYYDVIAGNGNGVRFWQSDSYKIHMGQGPEYQFGPVTDYSIKMNMDVFNNNGRGWTWGTPNSTPIAALNTLGNMQIAGSFTAPGLLVNVNPGNPGLSISGNSSGNTTSDISLSRMSSSAGVGNAPAIQFNDTGSQSYNLIQGSSSGLQFFNYYGGSGWIERMRLMPNGNVGIGATSSNAKLTVNLINANGWSGNLNALSIVSPDNNYHLDLNTYVVANGNVGYHFTPNGNTGMAITTIGNVGIGTTSPDAMLAVAGQIHAQEVKVSVTVPGPDYVFENNYHLTPLDSIKTYINQNKHLPDVPTAKEMEKNGVQLGEMNMLLLKKIEELTLYVIEQNKKLNTQNEVIVNQNDRITKLENRK